MRFVWSAAKNRRNRLKHGITFEDAVRIFEGPTLEQLDERFDYGELRIHAIGVVNAIEITVIYVEVSEQERRIISAWRSERHEREAYWKAIGQVGH
jgi:hypothetical protein